MSNTNNSDSSPPGAPSSNRLKADEEDEEEEGPKPLPYLFEKELIENQNRHIHLYDDFRGTATMCAPIDGKFYTQREQVALPRATHHYRQLLQPRREPFAYLPHRQSQVHGWLPTVGCNRAKAEQIAHNAWEINFISAPKLRCDMTVFGEKLFSERHTVRPAFNGLRFYV